MVLILAIAAVVVANVAVWWWQRRSWRARPGAAADESDLQAVQSAGVVGAGIGAAFARQQGLSADEDVKVREDTEPVRFKL